MSVFRARQDFHYYINRLCLRLYGLMCKSGKKICSKQFKLINIPTTRGDYNKFIEYSTLKIVVLSASARVRSYKFFILSMITQLHNLLWHLNDSSSSIFQVKVARKFTPSGHPHWRHWFLYDRVPLQKVQKACSDCKILICVCLFC